MTTGDNNTFDELQTEMGHSLSRIEGLLGDRHRIKGVERSTNVVSTGSNYTVPSVRNFLLEFEKERFNGKRKEESRQGAPLKDTGRDIKELDESAIRFTVSSIMGIHARDNPIEPEGSIYRTQDSKQPLMRHTRECSSKVPEAACGNHAT